MRRPDAYETDSYCAAIVVNSLRRGFCRCPDCEKTGQKGRKAAERTVERRVERETKKKTDEALDKVFEGDKAQNADKERNPADAAGAGNTGATAFGAYGKFDFVPGEKVIVAEDFSQDDLGDFPAKWNTNGSAEINTIAGSTARWLALTSKGAVTPEFITDLPENFTLEFDLAVTTGFSFYNSVLMISMVHLIDANNFTAWSKFGRGRTSGVLVWLHPQDAGSRPLGQSGYELWPDGKKTMENKVVGMPAFNSADKHMVKISIWRQKQRIRLYIDETKVWDLPRAFADGIDYNGLVFSRDGAKEGETFYISNLRLAVGAPDTRNKLITEGKFSTTGIYFNSGSAVIRPESYGVLKEIATVLKENPDVKVSIIGHTDSDGSEELNLRLSKERAAAVSAVLASEFGIDDVRMQTDGKGATEPIADNTTPEAKAQNRRVEFIRL